MEVGEFFEEWALEETLRGRPESEILFGRFVAQRVTPGFGLDELAYVEEEREWNRVHGSVFERLDGELLRRYVEGRFGEEFR